MTESDLLKRLGTWFCARCKTATRPHEEWNMLCSPCYTKWISIRHDDPYVCIDAFIETGKCCDNSVYSTFKKKARTADAAKEEKARLYARDFRTLIEPPGKP